MAKRENENINVSNRVKVLSIFAFIVLFIFLLPRIVYPNVSGNAIYSSGTVTKENFASYLEQQQIIKDLPRSGILNLKLFRIENSKKIFEESYIITKGRAIAGESQKPDFVIYLNSKYINDGDFCSIARKASKESELSYELKKSEFSLLLKYAGMLKYKGCLGM